MMRRAAIAGVLSGLVCASAFARGVSPYLPLNLSPDLDRKIERVLLLGDKTVTRRPIPAAVVLDALPKACTRDRAVCEEVRAYIARFMRKAAVTHGRVSATAVDGDGAAVLPNGHGLHADNAWEVRAQAHYQPSDYLLISAGGIARDEHATPTDSMVSLGFDFAQLDVGYRDHWLSALNDSSMLIGTQAPTMLSATLSNYTLISRFGFSYEIFAAEMSNQDGIVFEGGVTSGKPRLAGLQLAIEPAEGYTLAFNRLTQYGGGERDRNGLSDFLEILFGVDQDPDAPGQPTEIGNRAAAFTSSMIFQGRVPFAVHMEYAGEDNTYRGAHRLGETSLSLGVDFPVLWDDFDAGFETSEWQNTWYAHHLYPLGLTNEEHVLGHWFGDNRLSGDAIGGDAYMLRAGWRLPRGDYAQAILRTLEFDQDWTFGGAQRPYQTMRMLELNYSTQLFGRAVDAQLHVGEDIFGDSFARLGAAVDFAPTRPRARGESYEPDQRSGAEIFVDAGVQYSRAREYLFLQFQQRATTSYAADYHFGVGARRRVSERSDLGVRLELDRVADADLLSLRALDYRYRFNRKLALTAFAGAGRYQLGLPAHGYYIGAGVQYLDAFPGWDIGLDYRYFDKLSRDKGLASDPESNPGMPRRVIDVNGLSLYVSKRW